MSSFKLYVIMLVALAVLALAIPCSAETWGKWHVHVVNGLSSGRTLFVHCKSKDDDLGIHNLAIGTETNWSFRENFIGTTLFWCYLRTDREEYASFDVFWEEHDHKWLQTRCNWKDCIWTARDDGIYIKNIPNNSDELIHKWGSHW
ncbi:hypothetical protein ACLB2K_016118 [Fragaria x ananassa]